MGQPPGVGVFFGATAGELTREIVAALEETAWHLAGDLEDTEALAAALTPPRPGIIDAVAKLRRRAELLGIAHAYFKEVAEHPETPVVFDRTVYGGVTRDAVTKP